MIDVVLITVYCDDPSHSPKQAKVGMFKRYEHGRRGWDLISAGDFAPTQYQHEVRESRALLDGDDLADDQLVSPWRLPEHGRMRFKLACPLCGLAMTARDDRLAPILDVLEAHAEPAKVNHRTTRAPRVARVPLRWLAAKVASKQ